MSNTTTNRLPAFRLESISPAAMPYADPADHPELLDPPAEYRPIPATFTAAVEYYQAMFWRMADRPAREAYHLADDAVEMRWWAALPGQQVVCLEILRQCWPDHVAAGMRERDRFIKAVRESGRRGSLAAAHGLGRVAHQSVDLIEREAQELRASLVLPHDGFDLIRAVYRPDPMGLPIIPRILAVAVAVAVAAFDGRAG